MNRMNRIKKQNNPEYSVYPVRFPVSSCQLPVANDIGLKNPTQTRELLGLEEVVAHFVFYPVLPIVGSERFIHG